jgi:hypothetical protein
LSLRAERARVFLSGCRPGRIAKRGISFSALLRFDKLARKFLATVMLASTRLWLKAYVSVS